MTTPDADTEHSHPIQAYYHDGVTVGNVNGLPIPFGGFVVPRNGSSAGNRLSLKPSDTSCVIQGDWLVVEESQNGYPAALHNRTKDAAVAATLGTIGKQRFWNALVGYDDDVGTFAVAELRGDLPGEHLQRFPCDDTTESLAEILQAHDGNSPFLWERRLGRIAAESTFVCHRIDGHHPWKILSRCHLDGFAALRERYETAAGAIGKRFNPVPPKDRGHPDPPRGQDTTKAADLQEMYKEKISEKL